MARTNMPTISRHVVNPELSELMAPFLVGAEVEGLLTPYRIAVLVILEQYITFDSPDDFPLAEKRRIALGFLKLFRSTYRPFEDLKRIVCVEFGSEMMDSIFQIFCKRVVNMDLDLFVSMFYGCIATITYGDGKHLVKSTSFAGQFARRLFICYKKASFSDLCRLWLDFRQYFNSGTVCVSRNINMQAIDDHSAFDGTAMDDSSMVTVTSFPNGERPRKQIAGHVALRHGQRTAFEPSKTVLPDRKDAVGFILKQVRLLVYDPSSALSYSAIAQWIRQNRIHLPSIHEMFFLEYLNELRIRNLPSAEAALHRYIDCAGLSLINKSVFDAMVSDHRLTGHSTNVIPTSAFRSLRYGPLLLADMHRRFGNQGKALAYLQECIKNAEEANDKTCLDYAVALNFMLDFAGKRTDHQRLIRQSLVNTEERNATALHFRCHLVQLLKNIRDCKNAKSITDVTHIIFHELCERSSASNAGDNASHWSQHSIRNVVRASLSSAYLQRGYWNAACLESQKLIYSMAEKTSDVRSIAVVNLAYSLAAMGRYNGAKKLVADSAVNFPMCTTERDRLNLADALISFESAFLLGDDDICLRQLLRIEALSPAEANIRRAVYQSARANCDHAVQSMSQFLSGDGGKEPYVKCRALLILGDIFLHRVGKIGLAQEYLLQCQRLAEQFRFPQISAMATYGLLEAKAALGVGTASSGTDDQEEASFLTALQTCRVALSKARLILNVASDTEIGASNTVALLEKVVVKLEAMNANLYLRQAHALLGIAYERLRNTDKRNRASRKYRDLNESLRRCGFTALIF